MAEGGDVVDIYCTTACADLFAKWLHVQIQIERFIVAYDSLSFNDYNGVTVQRKYLHHIVNIIEVELGLKVVYAKNREAYAVDTRHFIHNVRPYICPCGRPLLKNPSGSIALFAQ